MKIPKLKVPTPPDIPALYFKPPSADVPSFPPIVVPPSNLKRSEGVKAEETEEPSTPVAPSFKIPIIDLQMPLPTAEVVATATYAAVAAVATTTLATPFFEQIKKKLQKFLQGKIDKWKKKRKEKKEKVSLAN